MEYVAISAVKISVFSTSNVFVTWMFSFQLGSLPLATGIPSLVLETDVDEVGL